MKEPTPQKIIKIISAAMKTKGINQYQLHKLTLISESSLSRIIKSNQIPKIDTLLLIFDKLDIEMTIEQKKELNNINDCKGKY